MYMYFYFYQLSATVSVSVSVSVMYQLRRVPPGYMLYECVPTSTVHTHVHTTYISYNGYDPGNRDTYTFCKL